MDKKHNVTQANWANIWKAKTAYQYIACASQMKNINTDNTSLKIVN